MKDKIILSLFDQSGIIAYPWVRQGYGAILVDSAHPKGWSGEWPWMYAGFDLSESWNIPKFLTSHVDVSFIAAFPPCDHLAVSGSRWFKGKGLRALSKSISQFATAVEICESFDVPYFIENPVSTISTYWRKPDYYFHPYQYAGYAEDYYTKKTCLWVGNNFIIPHTFYDPKMRIDTTLIHYKSGKQRQIERSLTPVGFSEAVYLANS